MFRTVVRPRSHGFSARGTLGVSLIDFQTNPSATSSAAAYIKTIMDGPGPLESRPPSGGVSKVFRRVSSWVLGSGLRQVPEHQVRDAFFVGSFSCFLHSSRSMVSRKSRPPRVLVSPDVLGRGRPILGTRGVGSGRRSRSPALKKIFGTLRRAELRAQRFLEVRARSFSSRGVNEIHSPPSASSCASTGTPAHPSSRSFGALS